MKMSKTNRKWKIALWAVGVATALVLVGFLALTVVVRQAVKIYRSDTAEQLNAAIGGQESGVPVELRRVLLGELLNGDYTNIKSLETDYQKLLTDVKSYVTVLAAHDALIEQYNAGIKGDKPLGGDLLVSVNRYMAAFENRFPGEKDRIKAISDLSAKITSNTNFDAVSGDIDDVLQSGDKFLAELRESLNARILEFSKKVN
ncbi:hypothetical protein FWD20_02445 [Candidatus Saccharibacteria bacterium]|nr:hypothetical protein [Candidatus Saccharibacteria bacterium]